MKNYINNRWVDAKDKKTYPVFNTYTKEKLGDVPLSGPEDIDFAIACADGARVPLRKWSLRERITVLKKLSDEIEKRKDSFVDILVKNGGETRKYAETEVQGTIYRFEEILKLSRRMYSEIIPSKHNEKFSYVLNEPQGVVAAIVPPNSPLILPAWVTSCALLSGNPLVIKPSNFAPLPSLMLAKIIDDMVLPKGTFNVVTGQGSELGDIMVKDLRVKTIAFFGSTRIGKLIYSESAKTLKSVYLDLPGKNPMIILDDCDLEKAANRAVYSAFVNQGQICMSTELLLVQKNIIAEFEELLLGKIKNLVVGDPDNPDTDVGPIPEERIVQLIKNHIEDSLQKGATLLCGGKIKGMFVEPTILKNVNENMLIFNDRTSGPVAGLMKIDDVQEGVKLVNNMRLGLRASIFTNNIKKSMYAVNNLDVGTVMVNENPFYVEEHMPHGGVNDAGVNGAQYLIDCMLRKKLVIMHDLE